MNVQFVEYISSLCAFFWRCRTHVEIIVVILAVVTLVI